MKKSDPCLSCPYKLGLVKAVVNPCPECKKGGYRALENLKDMLKKIHGQPENIGGKK